MEAYSYTVLLEPSNKMYYGIRKSKTFDLFIIIRMMSSYSITGHDKNIMHN